MTSLSAIADVVIGRLAVYLRTLTQLAQEGHEVTSSHELSRVLGITSAQIRKDLSYFGGFGKQGTGYRIVHLQAQLAQILQVNQIWPVIVVGAGDLGRAIARSGEFAARGFQIVGLFDNDPEKIGIGTDGFRTLDTGGMVDFIQEKHIQIAIVAVPAQDAQQVTDTLVCAGVCAILSYAPITLCVPGGVHLQYIDPVTHLQHMTYHLVRENNERIDAFGRRTPART